MMFENMLIALDGSKLSEEVLPFATAIAKKAHSHPTLFHVVDVEQFTPQVRAEHSELLEPVLENERMLAHAYLQLIRARLADEGVRALTAVAAGSPGEAIASHAHFAGIEMIAMTTHGRSGIARW